MQVGLEQFIQYENVTTDNISAAFEPNAVAGIDMLRLDKVHPVISGNKWFKLKYFLQNTEGKKRIITFGGAYSNHLVATACAAQLMNIQATGIVRGEEPASYSPTLQDACDYGMQLIFTTRQEYNKKNTLLDKLDLMHDENLIINEGGLGELGVKGAKDILLLAPDLSRYSHIVCSVGTGTMMAGIVLGALPHQHITGISTLKGDDRLTPLINSFLPLHHAAFELNFDYHFGGYAKKNDDLLKFMNHFFVATGIATDFVYSGKLVYAVNDLINRKYFPQNAQVLVIHCGGLQGNRSITDGSLIF